MVCSRTADYTVPSAKLVGFDTLILQPFTATQIYDYLAFGGITLQEVRKFLYRDKMYEALAHSPLLLNMMVLAYQNQTLEPITANTLDEHRQQLFEGYIAGMLSSYKRLKKGEDVELIKHQLVWLAQQLTKRNQIIFFIEQLQPDCLPSRKQQLVYRRTVELVMGVFSAFIVLIVFILSFSLLDETILGASVGLVGALISGWVIGRFSGQVDIVPVERLRWRWKNTPQKHMARKLVFRLIGGSLVGLVIGLVTKTEVDLIVRLAAGVILGSILGLIWGPVWMLLDKVLDLLVGGLVNEFVEIRKIPNEGIRNSFRNAILVGIVFATVLALLLGAVGAIFLGLVIGLPLGLSFGIIMGLGFGLVGGLMRGGLMAVIQHYILRFLLHRYNILPFHLVSFLDSAAERLILRKVGGGYQFVHRLLQDYLASLYVEEGEGS